MLATIPDLFGVAAIIAAIGTSISSVIAAMNKRQLTKVHEEIKVGNGKTMAVLAELSEGRRIRREIPQEERTEEESEYVASLEVAEAEARAAFAREQTQSKPKRRTR